MRKILTTALFVSLLFLANLGVSHAQGQLLNASPGVLPDSPFYLIERLKQKIVLTLTFDQKAKAEKLFNYAEERLAEAEAMLTKQNPKLAEETLGRYVSFLLRGQDALQKAEAAGARVAALKELQTEASIRQQVVLQNIFERIPEEGKAGVLKAMDASRTVFLLASQTLPEVKSEVIIQNSERRLPGFENFLPQNFLADLLKLVGR
ncbi:MAG: DUF5667 domain-containing protein [Patescibacteria group bacterium]